MTLLFVWSSHPAPCWVREFSPHIPGRHFCKSSRKSVQPPHLSQEGSGARFRLHLPDSAALSSALLSSSGEAIPEQLCRPSVLAFIVLILQRALVSGSRAHSGVFRGWSRLSLSPCRVRAVSTARRSGGDRPGPGCSARLWLPEHFPGSAVNNVCVCTHLRCGLLLALICFQEAWFLITLQVLLVFYPHVFGTLEGRAGLHSVMPWPALWV